MRLSVWFTAPLALSGGQSLDINYRDDNYRDSIGWREIVVRPSGSISVLASNVHSQEISDELRSYPQDMLAVPLNDRDAKLLVVLNGSTSAVNAPSSSSSANGPFRDIVLPIVLFLALAGLSLGAILLVIRARHVH